MARRKAVPHPTSSDAAGPGRDDSGSSTFATISATSTEDCPRTLQIAGALPDRRTSIVRALETLWG